MIHLLVLLLGLLLVPEKPDTFSLTDPLLGSTQGTLVSGTLTDEGFRAEVEQGQDHVRYDLPGGFTRGSIAFEVRGVHNDSGGQNGDPAFLGLYDGRGVTEPAEYFQHFKNNHYRLVLLWRQNRQGVKGVVNTAAVTDERRSAERAVFTDTDGRDWSTEPTGPKIDWEPDRWYAMKLTWGPDGFVATRDGEVVWKANRGPFPYAPVEPRLWIGCAPGYGDKYTNAGPDWIFRNLEITLSEPLEQ
jgi:hypothetical protein